MCPKDTADLTLGIVLVHNTHTRRREIVLIQDRRKKTPRYWKLPGGSIQEGESPYTAMVREMREETTVILPDTMPEHAHLGVRHQIWSNSMRQYFSVHLFAFVCKEEEVEHTLTTPNGTYTEHGRLKVARIPVYKVREGRVSFLPNHEAHIKAIAPALHAVLFSL